MANSSLSDGSRRFRELSVALSVLVFDFLVKERWPPKVLFDRCFGWLGRIDEVPLELPELSEWRSLDADSEWRLCELLELLNQRRVLVLSVTCLKEYQCESQRRATC